jgi:hypothetical protein
LSSFSKRYALENLGKAGICLDLETGNFFSLNETAFEICVSLTKGKRTRQIQSTLISRYALSTQEAARAVAAVIGQLQSDYPQASLSPLTFTEPRQASRASARRQMHWQGSPILEIAQPLDRLRWIGTNGSTAAARADWVRVAAPHLLVGAGQPVLHASAVLLEGSALAFCGPSGSGKSTCARLLSDLGWAPLSEDLLVFSTGKDPHQVLLSGETLLCSWAEEKARRMTKEGSCPAGLNHLIRTLRGATAPLSMILFLDATRRGGTRVGLQLLSKVEALSELLKNAFAECRSKQLWLQLLKSSRALLETVPAARATVPDGVDALRGALAELKSQLEIVALGGA